MIWSLVLTAVSAVNILLIGQKRRVGWLVGLGGQLLWVAYAVTTGQYGFLIGAAIYTVIQVRAYRAWGREEAIPHERERATRATRTDRAPR